MNSRKHEFVVEECDPEPMMGKENLQWLFIDPKLYKAYVYKNMAFILIGDQKKPELHKDEEIEWMKQSKKNPLIFKKPHYGKQLDGVYFMKNGLWQSMDVTK